MDQALGVVLRNHTTFSLLFHKTERERHVCSNHSPLNVAHYLRVKKKKPWEAKKHTKCWDLWQNGNTSNKSPNF